MFHATDALYHVFTTPKSWKELIHSEVTCKENLFSNITSSTWEGGSYLTSLTLWDQSNENRGIKFNFILETNKTDYEELQRCYDITKQLKKEEEKKLVIWTKSSKMEQYNKSVKVDGFYVEINNITYINLEKIKTFEDNFKVNVDKNCKILDALQKKVYVGYERSFIQTHYFAFILFGIFLILVECMVFNRLKKKKLTNMQRYLIFLAVLALVLVLTFASHVLTINKAVHAFEIELDEEMMVEKTRIDSVKLNEEEKGDVGQMKGLVEAYKGVKETWDNENKKTE